MIEYKEKSFETDINNLLFIQVRTEIYRLCLSRIWKSL
jgi:hypothetical protein